MQRKAVPIHSTLLPQGEHSPSKSSGAFCMRNASSLFFLQPWEVRSILRSCTSISDVGYAALILYVRLMGEIKEQNKDPVLGEIYCSERNHYLKKKKKIKINSIVRM